MNLQKKNNLYLLCLSTGNYDDLGEIRFEEMKKAAKHFKFKDLRIIDDDMLQDGPWTWPAPSVSAEIESFIDHLKKKKNVKINAIVTFDE